ncbi:MAG: glycosyltransferase family 1 protein [Candidatus Falkowbacteria bacterium]|nr:glycosyltransferase family 1 protein [Candidatus Falkowbacteria bacterium]
MENHKKPKIGIDARFYGPLGKGLGRYTQEITDRIVSFDQTADYVIFLSPENFDSFQLPGKNYKKVKINIRWYSWREQVILPFYFYRENLDLLHFTHFNVPIFYRRNFIVTIHDLILTKFPSLKATLLKPWMYRLKNFAYRQVIGYAVKNSLKIIAVSKFTAEDIIKQFKISANKIEVTYEGVADNFLVDVATDSRILQQQGIDQPFFLYVGNAYPHKNLEGLLKAFSSFQGESKQHNASLVLVGKEDYFYLQIKKLAKDLQVKRVYFLGYVSDDDLSFLFSRALAYIFPSFYEGFGLPPLEAMSRGCPVVSSKEGSLPEILGDAALYFDPYDANDFLSKMNRVFSDATLRENLKDAGTKRVKDFSWQDCAKKTLAVYQKCLKIND